MKKLISIFTLVLIFVSCENDIRSNSPAFQGEKDNVFWKATDSKVNAVSSGIVSLNAYTEKELVVLTVPNSVGIHNLGTSNQNISASYSYDNSGALSYYKTSLVAGPVFKLTNLNSAGSGYASLNGNNVSTIGGSGNGLTVRIVANTAGAITSATIASRGTGYKAGDIVTIIGGANNATIGVLNVLKSNGTVQIEKIEGNLYTGTFSFNAVDTQGNVVNFNKGTFYKVPLF